MPKAVNISTSRVGETSVAKNGMQMTIIVYRKYNDIDIRFEDGVEVQHRGYDKFKSGSIQYPVTEAHIGETHIAKNGQRMTIVAYRNYLDADVQFEDGTLVYHKRYACIVAGQVINPNIQFKNGRVRTRYRTRIGEIGWALNGQRITIIAYRKSIDIDVEFEDGTRVYNVQYSKFKEGTIKNPNDQRNRASSIVGTELLMQNGLRAVVVDYRGVYDVDLRFETGCKVEHRVYRNFKIGKIGHPLPYKLNTICIDKPAYVFNCVGNFYCHCTKCGIRDIMTIDEIKSHLCNI